MQATATFIITILFRGHQSFTASVVTSELENPSGTWFPDGLGRREMSAAERAEEIQSKAESKFGNLGKGKYGRILKMAHTPTREEYKKTCYIAAIGLIVFGAVGFAIMWAMTYLPKLF